VPQPDSRPLRGVILDVDGVLVDSEPFTREAVSRLFAEKGVTVRPEELVSFAGTGEGHTIEALAHEFAVPVDLARDKERLYTIYTHLVRGRLRPLPGVFDFLSQCRRHNLKVAVASSADAIKVEDNLHEIGLDPTRLDALVDGSEVQRKKPAPDIFLRAAELLKLAPTVCLVVEDAIAGVAAAKAAGARCLALTTTFPADCLRAADWIAPDLAHIPPEVFADAPAGGVP
jgi:HAD superfamily hydrolase (TIGR01509 family)